MTKKQISFTVELFIGTIPFLAIFLLMAAVRSPEFWAGHSVPVNVFYYGCLLFVCFFGLRTKAVTDEMSAQLLLKVDQICFRLLTVALLAAVCVIAGPGFAALPLTRSAIGLLFCGGLAAFRLLRAFLFLYYNKKGL